MTVIRLAMQSLRNRWLTALLTVLAIAVSVMLLLGVEKIRNGARASFANTISGTDLVVGARSGGLQLLLYSVFRIGNATNEVTWRSYKDIASRPEVAWTIPIALGDSHRGYRVLGTTNAYFKHYRFRDKQLLTLQAGRGGFHGLLDTVIGADVARTLGYKIGDKIIVSHGLGEIGEKHDVLPFEITGILAKTGTPVDRTVHVSLEAIEAMHVDWHKGYKMPGQTTPLAKILRMKFRPDEVTAAFIGLKSRLQAFKFQRFVNDYSKEPLTAVLPGVALHQLWSLVGTAERALLLISVMVVITAILGMITMILATLNERRREIAILRSVGAGPRTVVGLLVAETSILTLAGVVLGVFSLYGLLIVARPAIDRAYGIYLEIGAPTQRELLALAAIILGGCLAGFVPAWRAYRLSLADGMMVRT